MISVVRWIGRGRLAERPQQYEMAADEMEALVAKQQAMAIDGKHDEEDIGKQFDDSDDTDDEEDEMEAMERMGKHIQLHADGEEDTEETAEGQNGDNSDGKAENGVNGHDTEDGQDEAMNDDEDEQEQAADGSAEVAATAEDEDDDPKAAALLDELQMDEYDNEPEGAELFLGGRRLTVHDSNAEDPYITVADDEDDDSDEEDVLIKPTDCVLCVGRTEDEHSAVEVYVYDEDKGSLFVHHDFQIPSFPLAFTHLNQGPAVGGSESSDEVGSYLAVGTFLPGIEVWNLNVMDVLEPVCTLGGHEDERVNVTSRKSKGRKLKEGSHEDAVLCLDWHAAHRERLVSGSADETVKLWDVTTQQCIATLTHHRDSRNSDGGKQNKKDKGKKSKAGKGKSKAHAAAGDDNDSWYEEAQHANLSHKVQSLHINPSEPSLLLTGSYDRTVHLVDMRTAGTNTAAQRVYRVESDVEMVRWHGRAPLFLVATESGLVYLFDARKGEQPLFRLAAHSSATTAAQFSPHIDGLFLTSSADKTVKLWSVDGSGGDGGVVPSLLVSKEMRVGSVWSASWDIDAAALLACGGDKGKLAVWDIRENAEMVRKYGKQLGEQQQVDVEPEQRRDTATQKPQGKRQEEESEGELKSNASKGGHQKTVSKSRKKTTAAAESAED